MSSNLIILGILSFLFFISPINCEISKSQKFAERIVRITFLDEIMSGRCELNMKINNESSDLFSLLDGQIRNDFKTLMFHYDRGFKRTSMRDLIYKIKMLMGRLVPTESKNIKNGEKAKQLKINKTPTTTVKRKLIFNNTSPEPADSKLKSVKGKELLEDNKEIKKPSDAYKIIEQLLLLEMKCLEWKEKMKNVGGNESEIKIKDADIKEPEGNEEPSESPEVADSKLNSVKGKEGLEDNKEIKKPTDKIIEQPLLLEMKRLELKDKMKDVGETESEIRIKDVTDKKGNEDETLFKFYIKKHKIKHAIEHGKFASELKKLKLSLNKKQLLKILILYFQLYNVAFSEISNEEKKLTVYSDILQTPISTIKDEILKIINSKSPIWNQIIGLNFGKKMEYEKVAEENVEKYLIKILKENIEEYEEVPQFEGYEENRKDYKKIDKKDVVKKEQVENKVVKNNEINTAEKVKINKPKTKVNQTDADLKNQKPWRH
uniref:Uncharacterized protein n=1 Tax=Meloidogyne hapla TaxID=6305 RepID=A0A1I8BP51_MELHA